MSGPKTAIELAESIQEGCINWSDRFFDHDEAVALIGTYVAARLSEAAERAEAWRDRWWGVRIPQRAGAESMQSLRSAIMGNSTGAPHPEPRQTADPLGTGAQWNQALDVVRNREAASSESIEAWRNDPLVHRLASMLEQWEREIDRRVRDEPRQTAGDVEALAVAVYNLATRGPWEKIPPDWPETHARIKEIAALIARKGE